VKDGELRIGDRAVLCELLTQISVAAHPQQLENVWLTCAPELWINAVINELELMYFAAMHPGYLGTDADLPVALSLFHDYLERTLRWAEEEDDGRWSREHLLQSPCWRDVKRSAAGVQSLTHEWRTLNCPGFRP
jgi:hypothetical protein